MFNLVILRAEKRGVNSLLANAQMAGCHNHDYNSVQRFLWKSELRSDSRKHILRKFLPHHTKYAYLKLCILYFHKKPSELVPCINNCICNDIAICAFWKAFNHVMLWCYYKPIPKVVFCASNSVVNVGIH